MANRVRLQAEEKPSAAVLQRASYRIGFEEPQDEHNERPVTRRGIWGKHACNAWRADHLEAREQVLF